MVKKIINSIIFIISFLIGFLFSYFFDGNIITENKICDSLIWALIADAFSVLCEWIFFHLFYIRTNKVIFEMNRWANSSKRKATGYSSKENKNETNGFNYATYKKVAEKSLTLVPFSIPIVEAKFKYDMLSFNPGDIFIMKTWDGNSGTSSKAKVTSFDAEDSVWKFKLSFINTPNKRSKKILSKKEGDISLYWDNLTKKIIFFGYKRDDKDKNYQGIIIFND